jgi:hypothetical protein
MVGHFKVVITSCKVKRSRVPACAVSAVNVVLGEELVHPAKVALLGSVQQGRVPSQQIHHILVTFLDAEPSFFVTNP